jgi:ELWxxDGT repeat protein
VRDINATGTDSSSPYGFTALGDWLYFQASEPTTGRELWRTNGTITELVRDINTPGFGGSNPSALTTFADWIYFQAYDSTHGYELWRTNGTITELVRDINTTGTDGSSPYAFTALGDWLYFTTSDDGTGIPKLRRVNVQGTIESAVLPGTGGFIGCMCENALIALDERLFMVLSTSETGFEFAYLDEPTFGLPETNRDGSVWSTALVLLAAVTAAAGLTVRMGASRR